MLSNHCRKPRVTTQITAQQVAQSVFTPPPPKKERKERKLERKSDRLSVDAATPGIVISFVKII